MAAGGVGFVIVAECSQRIGMEQLAMRVCVRFARHPERGYPVRFSVEVYKEARGFCALIWSKNADETSARLRISTEFACIRRPVSIMLRPSSTRAFLNITFHTMPSLAWSHVRHRTVNAQGIVLPLHPGTGHHGANHEPERLRRRHQHV
jgi:hypothetical protein